MPFLKLRGVNTKQEKIYSRTQKKFVNRIQVKIKNTKPEYFNPINHIEQYKSN